MLGFDAYTKSVITSIVEQRIRIFLIKRKIIDLPLIEKYFGNPALKSPILKKLFHNFKSQLTFKDDVYEDYAFASILIKDPDYSFLSNDASVSIAKANTALADTFDRVATTLFKGAAPSTTDSSSDLADPFSYLKQPQFQREIPYYAQQVYQPTSVLQPFDATFLWSDQHDDGQRLISQIKSPFYIEFFYRLKPDVKVALPLATVPRENYNYYSKHDKVLGYIPGKNGPGTYLIDKLTETPAAFNSNFNRGVRLMFNLTAAMDLFTSPKPVLNYKEHAHAHDYKSGHPLVPSKQLPFYAGGGVAFRETYPLPFLSNFNQVAATNYWDNNNLYFNSPLAAALGVFSQNIGISANVVKKKANYFRGPYEPEWNTYNAASKTYGKAPKEASFYYDISHNSHPMPNAQYLKRSKSLISFEHEKNMVFQGKPIKGLDVVNLYFPMIVGEYIDLSANTADDASLVDKLLEEKNIKYLKTLVKTSGEDDATGYISGVIQSFALNEINIQLLSAENNSPFDTSIAEKGLDNMLLNLINFDEE
tara:strand:- start:1569 stop:3170 length:1602 start_codon:yes stop_codon:yes gene_type:complete